MTEKKRLIVFFIFAFILLSFFLPFYHKGRKAVNTNETIRIYLAMAIARNGTGIVDRQVRDYGLPLDRAEKDGHIYCDKTPGLSFLAVPPYLVILLLKSLLSIPTPFYLVVYFLRIITIVLPTVLMICFMLNMLKKYLDSRIAYLCTTVYLLGTLAFPMSTVFFGHQAAAVLCFLSYYLAKNAIEHPKPRLLIASGLLGGAGIVVELPTLLIAGAIFILLAIKLKKHSSMIFFLVGILPPLAVLMFYNHICFGGWFQSGYAYTQHYFKIVGIKESGFAAIFHPPSLKILWHLTFSSYRGFFFFSPVLIFSFYGLWLWHKEGHTTESIILTGLIIAYFTFVSALRDWPGGWSPGPRHLTPLVPLMILPLGAAAQKIACLRNNFGAKTIGGILFCSSALISIANYFLIECTFLYFPWGVFNPLKDISLRLFLNGKYTFNVLSFFGLSDWVGVILSAGVVAAMITIFCRVGWRRILTSPYAKLVVLLVSVGWFLLVFHISPRSTLQGETFLNIVYKINGL